MEIFTQAGGIVLSRYAHLLAGITWIGILYYFNFVQVPSFAQFDAAPRNEAISKLVPRALWWFRWGAVLTLLSGLSILAFQEQLKGDYMKSPSGMSIATGVLLALVMFANVWVVIWPNQRKVIANAQNVLAGGEADPSAAAAGRKALLASRTNAFFSIPMVFFMVATSHFAPVYGQAEGGKRAIFYLIVVGLTALFELNGLGVFGVGPSANTSYLDKHKSTIIGGFLLFVVFYLAFELLLPS